MSSPLSRPAARRLSLLFLLGAVMVARWPFGRIRDSSPAAFDFGDFPRKVSGWEAVDIPVAGAKREALGDFPLLFRQYRAGGRAVNLYLVSGGGDRAALHPPEYCYVGGSTELTEEGARELPDGRGGTFRARRFVAGGPRGRSLVYYWYTFGDRVITSYLEQQALIVIGRLLGRTPSAYLVRISVEGEFDPEEGDRAIEDFVRAALPGGLIPTGTGS
jgi:EpsI family protein